MMAHSAALRGVAQPFWCRWFLSPIVEFVNVLLICFDQGNVDIYSVFH